MAILPKLCPISLVNREMQSKTTMKYQLNPVKWLLPKQQKATHIIKDAY